MIETKRLDCHNCGLITATIGINSIPLINQEHRQRLCIPCLKDALYDLAVSNPRLILSNNGDELECHV